MNILTRFRGGMVLPLSLLMALAPSFAPAATPLYDLDFTEPETGSYAVLTGAPNVQPSAGPLTSALIFPAVASSTQISLPVNIDSPRYELLCDVLLHNFVDSDYAFMVRFDAGGLHTVNFHGGLNSIYAFQNSPFASQVLGSLGNDSVVRLGVVLDRVSGSWTVSLNGVPVASNPLNGAPLQSIGFALLPWIGGAAAAPDTFAALDNVTVIIPEPSGIALLTIALLAAGRIRRKA